MKDAFELWWEWATKPHESMLSIRGEARRLELSDRIFDCIP
jgi:hypothetical protein